MIRFEDYMAAFGRAWGQGHVAGLRLGQAAFNVLHEMRPDLANEIRDSTLDAFYNDGALADFFMWVAANWSNDV
jgi:hypothetical protein